MRVAMYLLGSILVAAGLAYVAHLFNVPAEWIGVGAVVAIGLGLMGAAQSARVTGTGTNVTIDER